MAEKIQVLHFEALPAALFEFRVVEKCRNSRWSILNAPSSPSGRGES
jgi:hypothetical protein